MGKGLTKAGPKSALSNTVEELGVTKIAGKSGTGYNESKGLTEGAEKAVIDSVPTMRVGQWMSKTEYEQFVNTGEIPRANVLTKGMEGYIKQANKGDYYESILYWLVSVKTQKSNVHKALSK